MTGIANRAYNERKRGGPRREAGRPIAIEPSPLQDHLLSLVQTDTTQTVERLAEELRIRPGQVRYHLTTCNLKGWIPNWLVLQIYKQSSKQPGPPRGTSKVLTQVDSGKPSLKEELAGKISWLLRNDPGAYPRLRRLIWGAY